MAFNSHSEDLATLFHGLKEGVDYTGTIGALTVFGPAAFPILVGKHSGNGSHQVVGAAARMGEGRIVGFSHDCYTHPDTLIKERLLRNCIDWVTASSKGVGEKNVGLLPTNCRLEDWKTTTSSVIDSLTESDITKEKLAKYDAIVLVQFRFVSTPALVDVVKDYVRRGGGLVTASTGWAFENEITAHPLNLVCNDAGFGWTKRYSLLPINSDKFFKPSGRDLQDTHAGKAWRIISNDGGAHLEVSRLTQLKAIVEMAESTLPTTHPFIQAVEENREVKYHETDLAQLLNGLEASGVEIGTAVVGLMTAYGPEAFTILAGKYSPDGTRQPIGVGARFGAGRVTAFAHTIYTQPGDCPGIMRLMTNCVLWTGEKGSQNLRVGVLNRTDSMEHWLSQNETQFHFEYFNDSGLLTEKIESIHVLILPDIYSLFETAHANAMKAFIKNGGGLVTCSTGWACGCDIKTEFPGNLLLRDADIGWHDDYSTLPIESGSTVFSTTLDNLKDTHAGEAWNLLLAHITKDIVLPEDRLNQLCSVINITFGCLGDDSSFIAGIRNDLESYGVEDVIPTEENAVRSPVDKLKLNFKVNYIYNADGGEELRNNTCGQCHPATRFFPGLPNFQIPRDDYSSVTIDTTTDAWYSTGIYAPPGEEILVKLRLPPRKKFSVQIGSHNDNISKKYAWKRCPVLTVRKPLPSESTELRLHNTFGGLVYLVQTDKGDRKPERIKVTVYGGMLAPYFVLGGTTLEEWKIIRARAAPWGELQTGKIILTLPTPKLVLLQDPIALMQFWDKVLDAMSDLGGTPRSRPYPERIVADVQISAGYMHAGYPVMMLTDDSVDVALSIPLLKTREAWGLYHELGHNHQVSSWNFDLVGEISNNMFALYVYETVCGITKAEARADTFEPKEIKNAIEATAKKGPNFEDWADDPFLGLLFYAQLQKRYGWDAYKKVFRSYQTLSPLPETEEEKVDQWLIQFSTVVGQNCAPLFKDWGVRISDTAEAAVGHLPPTDQNLFSLITT